MKKTMTKTLTTLLVTMLIVGALMFVAPVHAPAPPYGTFTITQNGDNYNVFPINGSLYGKNAVEFYNYDGEMGTGYCPLMQYGVSKIYIYLNPDGSLSLIVHHNVDVGEDPPVNFGINMTISGLPEAAVIGLSDDDVEFRWAISPTPFVIGAWPVHNHYDSEGGVINGLPANEAWTLTVYAGAANELNTWLWQNPADTIPLELLMYGDPGPISPLYISYSPAGVPVPEGEDVTVTPDPNLSLTFEEVTEEGTATAEVTATPPAGFAPLPGIIGPYYNVEVTATFTGTVTVAIHYDDTGLSRRQERNLEMATSDGGYPRGDVNLDGRVNAADVRAVTASLWTRPGNPRWNPAADLDGDGRVSVVDLLIVIFHFGDTGWTDITTGIDIVNNIIYGETDHFSGFGVHR
jgi:hypothetical protein